MKARLEALILWEKPLRSAGVFVVLLSVLVLTQYYSVLQLAAGFFTIVTGLNWVYVNTHRQGQRMFAGKSEPTHPHASRISAKTTYIPRDRVVRGAQLTVDVVEAVVQQITRLVLVEDSLRSAWAVGLSYVVWTLAKYISTKYLVGVFLVGVFSLPRLYLQNKELVDSHVAQHSARARELATQYGGVANDKAKEYYGQALAMINKKKQGAAAEAAKKAE